MHDLIHRLRIAPRPLLTAVVLVLVAGALLLGVRTLWGTTTALAAYFGILILIAPARRLSWGWQLAAAGWAFLVGIAGFLTAQFGLWAILVGLIVVSLAQAMFRFGQVAAVTRSPVNFVLFAAMPSAGAQLWQAALGAAIGIAVMVAAAQVLRAPHAAAVEQDDFWSRVREGLVLAAGCVILVAVGELLHFPRVTWALLALCMILAVDVGNRRTRTWGRILGTVVGAVLATAVGALPDPVAMGIAVVCAVLCVAYIRQGDYVLFIVFLTPAILLTSGGDAPPILAAERIVAVLAAAAVAILLTELNRLADAPSRVEGSMR